MFSETLKLAAQAILRNPMRSSLTVLGIVIGVAAVIAMVTIGNGTTAKVTAELGKLGSNMLFVMPGQFGPGRASTQAKSFTSRDVSVVRNQIAGIRAVAPVAQSSATIIFGGESRSSSVVGTTADYLIVRSWQVVAGRGFLEAEERGSAVCMIGDTIKTELFGSTDALGQRIRVGKISCEVIGVLSKKGQSGMGTDQDDTVIVPLRAFQRRIAGNSDIGTIMVAARDGVSTTKVQGDLERLMRERRRITAGEDDDFSVNDMTQIAETMSGTTTILTGLLGAVAAVSLLVGGIGIMNIMLVSVTERTREIGIRLAIGALERQVLTQFLVEATVLALFGGIVGILLGLGLAYAVGVYLDVPFVTSPAIILVAFAFSALIGTGFGYFPARQAARLNPIEALRHE
ncbi:multidrug ABC transporter substrate-binding protein [Mesorhizobium tianshanense]|uniref:Putative ABC transport system permease protein n=1 Tax=Mesorhizobium tianshanense TaxID=39844 RepID=A0A562P9Q7_9HYPH|nr:ABC transporter permease [Mesorhizobium tianshanense]TWI41192.1 putative ABC transport system permease protein [Mesorhizobium tianshanense]GLS35613.1 multidrug ABC transporter substrate-binding protein [Mesorhizobium tianshanense]